MLLRQPVCSGRAQRKAKRILHEGIHNCIRDGDGSDGDRLDYLGGGEDRDRRGGGSGRSNRGGGDNGPGAARRHAAWP